MSIHITLVVKKWKERKLTPEFFNNHPAQWRKKRQIALDSKWSGFQMWGSQMWRRMWLTEKKKMVLFCSLFFSLLSQWERIATFPSLDVSFCSTDLCRARQVKSLHSLVCLSLTSHISLWTGQLSQQETHQTCISGRSRNLMPRSQYSS